MESLQDLLVDELKDLWSAENQLTKALPKMAKAAESEKLAEAFRDHLEETKTHVERIEEAFKHLEGSPRGKKCAAMEGLIKEGEEIIKENGIPEVKDAGLIAAAQKVEHYEIASYGTAVEHAKALGLKEVAKLLQQTLKEEKSADETLTTIAVKDVNPTAMKAKEPAASKS